MACAKNRRYRREKSAQACRFRSRRIRRAESRRTCFIAGFLDSWRDLALGVTRRPRVGYMEIHHQKPPITRRKHAMGTILQMTKRGNRFEGGFAAEEDDRLKEIIKGMKEGSDELLKTDKKIRKILDAEPEQGRRITARIMRWLPIPQVLHGLLPSPLLKLMAEDRDALEFMERELRKNVDRLEEALDQLSNISLQKEAELKDLLADIA